MISHPAALSFRCSYEFLYEPLTATQAKVYQTKIHPTANQKNCRCAAAKQAESLIWLRRYQVHGSWRQAHCETYHAVKNICVQVHRRGPMPPIECCLPKVDLTAQGWVGNGKGCHPADGWNPVTYSTVKGSQQSFGHGEPPVGIVPGLDDIQLTIRSSVDPYIDASEFLQHPVHYSVFMCMFTLYMTECSCVCLPYESQCVHVYVMQWGGPRILVILALLAKRNCR